MRRVEHEGVVFYGFFVPYPDAIWQRCVQALQKGLTHADLAAPPEPATPRQVPSSTGA